MKFGLCSFVYRWWMGRPYYLPQSPLTLDGFLDKAHDHGVEAVLICNNVKLHEFSDEQIAATRKKADEYGLLVETGSRGVDVDYFVRMLDVSVALGSKVMRVVYDIDRSEGEEDVRKQLQSGIACMREVVPEAKKRGVELGLENGYTIMISEVRDFIEAVGDSCFGSCPDTCNSASAITRPEEVMEMLAPYAKQVHYKDYTVVFDPRGNTITGVALGDGQVNFDRLTEILGQNNYKGNIFLELYVDRKESEAETFAYEDDCVRRSLEFARQKGYL